MAQYHVTLGGRGFLMDPAAYAVRALPQPGPASVAGAGAPVSPDPFFERVQRQARFTSGQGQPRFADPDVPDGWTIGTAVVLTPDGALRIGPPLVDAGAGPLLGQGVRAFALYRGRLYAGLDNAPGDVWSFDGATWALAFTCGKPGIRALAAYKDFLYVGNGGDGAVQRWDGTTLTTEFTNAGATAVSALRVAWFSGGARLYVGNSEDGNQAWLQSYDGVALTNLGALEEPRIETLAVAGGRLYVCAADPTGQARGALYSYGGSSSTFLLEHAFADGYAVAAAPLPDGRLALGWSMNGRVLTWQQGTLTPLPFSAGAGAVPALATFAGALWVGFRDPVTATLGLLRYDPVPGALSTAATGAVGDAPLALGAFGASLYLGVQQLAGAARAYRADLAACATSGQIETAPFDGGLPDVPKSVRAASSRFAPLPAGASIALDYRVGSGAWVLLGTASTAGSDEAELPFPGGVEATALAFRARLTRGPGSADSPELRSVALRYVLAPPLRREWTLSVLLEGDAARPLMRLDNSPEPLTGRQLAAALWALRQQAGPLTFVDPEGRSYQVWLRDLKESTSKRGAALIPADQPWSVAQLTLVEA